MTDPIGTRSLISTESDFLSFSTQRLTAASTNIQRCADRLTDEQIWHRSGDWENSIGNLILHLEGNVRQFVLHAVAGEPDSRDRDREFSLSYRCSREELLQRFTDTLARVTGVLATLPESELVIITDPHTTGWGSMTKLECIYHAVGHFQLHTGQIIFLSKQLLHTDLDLSIPRIR